MPVRLSIPHGGRLRRRHSHPTTLPAGPFRQTGLASAHGRPSTTPSRSPPRPIPRSRWTPTRSEVPTPTYPPVPQRTPPAWAPSKRNETHATPLVGAPAVPDAPTDPLPHSPRSRGPRSPRHRAHLLP